MSPLYRKVTRLTPYLRESAIATEQRIADLHILIGAVGVPVTVAQVALEKLPLIMSGALYIGIMCIFLLYATIYRRWAPWQRHPLILTAGVVTLLDLIVATVIILNTGGLASPFWGLWAAVTLSYVIRFRFRWQEAFTTAGLFLLTIWTVWRLAPVQVVSVQECVVGFGFSLIGILGIGRILVSSERQAIHNGMAAEDATIHRIVNTVQHEVNNPLTIATGNLELLRQQDSGCSPVGLDKIEAALERISRAVAQLRVLEHDRSISGEGLLARFPLQEEREALEEREEE
ncbi:histidine kinase dimerization/phospho-acceptor domain-containing protein [Gemmatimonadota bacterium]